MNSVAGAQGKETGLPSEVLSPEARVQTPVAGPNIAACLEILLRDTEMESEPSDGQALQKASVDYQRALREEPEGLQDEGADEGEETGAGKEDDGMDVDEGVGATQGDGEGEDDQCLSSRFPPLQLLMFQQRLKTKLPVPQREMEAVTRRLSSICVDLWQQLAIN